MVPEAAVPPPPQNGRVLERHLVDANCVIPPYYKKVSHGLALVEGRAGNKTGVPVRLGYEEQIVLAETLQFLEDNFPEILAIARDLTEVIQRARHEYEHRVANSGITMNDCLEAATVAVFAATNAACVAAAIEIFCHPAVIIPIAGLGVIGTQIYLVALMLPMVGMTTYGGYVMARYLYEDYSDRKSAVREARASLDALSFKRLLEAYRASHPNQYRGAAA